ncbi:hypothetical protein AX16_009019 [Volvariella volvacea WC 439]|nr:hypothetical protein AX16_009019 [Volvariella volvacea WC 439]
MSSSSSLQLTLAQNNPMKTQYTTPEGRVLYVAESPFNSSTTTILRLTEDLPSNSRPSRAVDPRSTGPWSRGRRYHDSGDSDSSSVGEVEIEVGRIDPLGPQGTTLMVNCSDDAEIVVDILPHSSPDLFDSWSFIGPDNRHYKWQMFLQCPVLFVNENYIAPLARYRRAKLGIVSRSRKAFLEVFPSGYGALDLIISTFVTFIKQREKVRGYF